MGLHLGGQPASHPREPCSRPWVHCSAVGNRSPAASLTSTGARAGLWWIWQGHLGQGWHSWTTAPGTYHDAREHHSHVPCSLPVLSPGSGWLLLPLSSHHCLHLWRCPSGSRTHRPTLLTPSHPSLSPPGSPSPHGSIIQLLGDLQLVAPGSASLPPSSAPRAGRELHLSLSLLKGPISSAGSPGCSASSSSCWHSSAAAAAAASPGHVIPVPSSLGSCCGPPLPVGRGALRAGVQGVPGVAAPPPLGQHRGLIEPAQPSPWDHKQTLRAAAAPGRG